jgi:SOS-response transcriptional repressor LexA
MTTTTRPIAPPTARALEVLAWIDAYCVRHGYSPTVRDICTAFKWSSPNTAALHLDRLQIRGLVEAVPGTARTLRVTPAGRAALAEA